MTKIFLRFLYRRYFLQEAMGYSYWNLKNTSLVSSDTWWYTDKGNTTQWNGTLHLINLKSFSDIFLISIVKRCTLIFINSMPLWKFLFVCFFYRYILKLDFSRFYELKISPVMLFSFFFWGDCNNCNCVRKMYENFNEDVLHVQIYIHVRM